MACVVGTALFSFGAAVASGQAPGTVTFNRDVAPIVFTQCAGCHRPDGSAPFSLLTHTDVRQRSTRIAEVTAARYMPPWKPEPGHGEFAGARRLTSDQIDLIRRWVEQGSVEGAASDLSVSAAASPRPFNLEPADLTVTMTDAYVLAAAGSDVFRTFVIPVPSPVTRYVSALEFRTPGTTAVHHANIKLDQSRASRRLDQEDGLPGFDGGSSRDAIFPDGHFLGWTPGQSLQRLTDTPWALPPNSDLVVEVHMQPTGKTETIKVSIGLHFTPEPPRRVPYMIRLGSQRIDIPPGATEYVSTDEYVLPVDVELRRVQPHAHNLARAIEGRARRPDGTTEWLIDIRDWDFKWQDVYEYAKPLVLPAGTTVAMRYTYDNSARNPRNPNSPPRRVRFGQTSSSEMGDLWLQVVTRDPADRAALDRDYAPKMLREDIAGVETALETSPLDARLHADLALCYIDAGRTADAVASFERSLQLDPRSAATHYDLGTLLLRERRFQEARRRFERALQIKPDFAEAHNNLGAALTGEGRGDEAMRAYHDALRIDPRNREAHYNLGRGLAAAQRWLEAAAEFGEALQLMPEDAETNAAMGSALSALGRNEDAIRHYRAALAANADLPAALADLAWLLATAQQTALRKPGEAVRLAERLATITQRQDATALDTLAVAYFSAGRVAEAIATAETALDRAQTAGQDELAIRIRQRRDFYQGR